MRFDGVVDGSFRKVVALTVELILQWQFIPWEVFVHVGLDVTAGDVKRQFHPDRPKYP